MKQHPLQILTQLHKKNPSMGIYSVCSSNPFVIEAAIAFAKKENSFLLVESTSNQVDQFGGYSGMTPVDFISFVHQKADDLGFNINKIIFGGDHLGPNVWQKDHAETAMKKAADQIRAYVTAGYTKIHLDTSMPCSDDEKPLKNEIIAERAAFLCKIAEETKKQNSHDWPVVYIVGTEVPVPGGAAEELEAVTPTTNDEIHETIQLTQRAFLKLGLQEAWERVISVVVQPGVEFSNTSIVEFDPDKSKSISLAIENYPSLSYEAHSTDYQTKEKLKELVKNHFMILKVGPGLTFAFREAVFALAYIEQEMFFKNKREMSDILNVIEKVMNEKPGFWKSYYHGDETSQLYNRRFGLSDRIRYYWPETQIQDALNKLIVNLNKNRISNALLSQFLPEQYKKIRQGELRNDPKAIINDKISQVLLDYSDACSAKNNYTLLK